LTAGSLFEQTKLLLRRYDLRARKRLGQHFLVNGQVLKVILSAAEITAEDTVVEVGPGLGILTAKLAEQAGKVIAVELDDTLARLLKERLSQLPNLTVINEDILKLDPQTLLSATSVRSPQYKVVANLPYYITSPVLRHFLESSAKPVRMIVMVQKEVAQAIVAEPGERSVLSVITQFYGKPSIVSYVPARSFYPAPEVDSAVLRIDVYPAPKVNVSDAKGFFQMVQAGFTARRKQIANSLAQGLKLPKAEAARLLNKAEISPQRRAETLTIEEWAKLWWTFEKLRKDGAYVHTAGTG
jgi:16S rRNA (adenine1518-N6/adenine1519-N6)-dimethyltransferase